MTRDTVRLDNKRRAIIQDGQTRRLQEKTWQVAKILADNYPATVSRERIIDQIWNGNVLVGEKGLNQAIWQLRRALDESTREPHVIRTIPRVGYQWLQPPPDRSAAPLRTWSVGNFAKLAGISCLLGVALAAPFVSQDSDAPFSLGTARNPASDAYLVGRDVHLVFRDGSTGRLINANSANIEPPVLSRNGTELAIAVLEDGRCRMLTIDLATREREDFGECPGT